MMNSQKVWFLIVVLGIAIGGWWWISSGEPEQSKAKKISAQGEEPIDSLTDVRHNVISDVPPPPRISEEEFNKQREERRASREQNRKERDTKRAERRVIRDERRAASRERRANQDPRELPSQDENSNAPVLGPALRNVKPGSWGEQILKKTQSNMDRD